MDTDSGQVIQEDSSEPSHYAMIPKMAMMDLNPYELTLYCHYKMTASEHGKCWKSNNTLATETGMSTRRLQEARDTLAEKGFITITYTPDDKGNINTPPTITIISIWAENRTRYAKKDAPPMHQVHPPHAPNATPHASGAPKEYPIKNNHLRTNIPKPPKGGKVVTPRKSWGREKTEAYYDSHTQDMAILIEAWGNSLVDFKHMTTVNQCQFCMAYHGLDEIGFSPDNYQSLSAITHAKLGSKWGLNPVDMLSMVEEWRNSRLAQPPAPKSDVPLKDKPISELSSYEVQQRMHMGMEWDGQS